MAIESATFYGKNYKLKEILQPWQENIDQAKKERDQYLPQVKINRKFSVGKQHLNVSVRDGRVVEVQRRHGLELVTSDILTQYIQTAIGKLSGNDYKSSFLPAPPEESALVTDIAKQLNASYGWGWDNEWLGDHKLQKIVRHLVIDGTCGIRVRYDRRFGEVIGEFPYHEGVPILDDSMRMKYMEESFKEGKKVDLRVVREGQVKWEFLSFENILWPAGFDDPVDFPWDLIVRPVSVKDLKSRYPKMTKELQDEEINSPGSLTAGLGIGDQEDVKIRGQVLVYTGYLRPCSDYPKGQTVLMVPDQNIVLDVREQLPYPDHPAGPRTGVHYFRWQVIPGRFPGRAFIEGGIGPQKIRNKRLTQINAIMDRGLPKVFIEEQSLARPQTGEPLEVVEVRPGSPLPKVESGVQPGAWMLQDVKLQEENAERALGIAPVTRGNPPQGVSAYSALALLTENDALKFDPIAESLRLEMTEVAWDTMEAMRNWPPNKQILIAGPDGALQAFEFNSNLIPPYYLVRPPRGGALPRTQAAELQKINDIWLAAAGRLPLTWYIESLNQGKAQELPPSVGDADAHKAELENVIMAVTGNAPPVAPYDDDARHVESHRAAQIKLKSMADMGDPQAAMLVEVHEMHINEHLQSAQGQAAAPPMGAPLSMNPPLAPGAPPPTGQTPPVPGLESPQTGNI